jgi:hypothetical protein
MRLEDGEAPCFETRSVGALLSMRPDGPAPAPGKPNYISTRAVTGTWSDGRSAPR